MKYLLIIFVALFLSNCTRSDSQEEKSMIEIDSLALNSQLRSILYSYMKAHPQYGNIVIYTDIPDAWNYKTENSYFSIEPMLYYDFTNHSSRERGCPVFYTSLNAHKVFIASRLDNLFLDKCSRSFIKRNSLPYNVTYLRGYQGWYIEATQNGKYNILTKQCAGFYFDTIKVERMNRSFNKK